MSEKYIDHEVRIRLLEKIVESNKETFHKIENKIDTYFKFIIFVLLAIGLANLIVCAIDIFCR